MGQTLPCPLRVWWRERHPGSGGGISRFGVESVGNVGRGQINNGTHVASQYKNDTSIPEVLSTSVPFGSAATDQVTLWAVCGGAKWHASRQDFGDGSIVLILGSN